MSTQAQLDALNTEINRSRNHLRYLEERLTPQQLQAAQKLELKNSRETRSAKITRG